MELWVHESDLGSLPRTPEARDRRLDAPVDHPQLLQRPLITADDGTAVVARDPGTLALLAGADRPVDGS